MDENILAQLSGRQAGQPDTSSAETPQDAKQPEYLTREQALELVAQATKDAIRQQQSMTDKAEARIKREVEARIAALQKAGVTVTPDQANAIRQATAEQMQAPEDKGQPPAFDAAQATTIATPATNPVVDRALGILDGLGVTIDDTDPEIKLIDQATEDPAKFLASVKAAGQAKAARVRSQAIGTRLAPQQATGQQNSVPDGLSPMDLFNLAYKR